MYASYCSVHSEQFTTPYRLSERIGSILRFTDDYLRDLAKDCRSSDRLLTYRTDTAYAEHHPDPVYTASWHRRLCARLLHQNPQPRIDFQF